MSNRIKTIFCVVIVALLLFATACSQTASNIKTETVLETSTIEKNDETTSLVTTEAEISESVTTSTTEPTAALAVERAFTINGVLVDATGSSAGDSTIAYVERVLKELPSYCYDSCVRYIYLLDEFPEEKANVNAISRLDLQTIYIKTVGNSNSKLKSVIYHEFGHFFDWEKGNETFFSREDEWIILLSEEGSKIKGYSGGISDELSYSLESFAVAFDAYHTGTINGKPFDLQAQCPGMYRCINNLVRK